MDKFYYRGDMVTFTAQRPAVYRGVRYKVGQQLTIQTNVAFDPYNDEGFGDGGPWGWGGFTARRLKQLEK